MFANTASSSVCARSLARCPSASTMPVSTPRSPRLPNRRRVNHGSILCSLSTPAARDTVHGGLHRLVRTRYCLVLHGQCALRVQGALVMAWHVQLPIRLYGTARRRRAHRLFQRPASTRSEGSCTGDSHRPDSAGHLSAFTLDHTARPPESTLTPAVSHLTKSRLSNINITDVLRTKFGEAYGAIQKNEHNESICS